MYRIAWNDGNYHGHGDYYLTLSLANAWLKYCNMKYPNIRHYIESMYLNASPIEKELVTGL